LTSRPDPNGRATQKVGDTDFWQALDGYVQRVLATVTAADLLTDGSAITQHC